MKKQTTTMSALHTSLMKNTMVNIMTIEYRSEVRNMKAKRDGNPLGKIFEVQFANIMIGADYKKRYNKVLAGLATAIGIEVPKKEVSELSWGSLSPNRKVRYNANGEASIHCFRLRKVRKSEGYFTNEAGEVISSDLVAKWRKKPDTMSLQDIENLESEAEKISALEKLAGERSGWRAYKLANIISFNINGTRFIIE